MPTGTITKNNKINSYDNVMALILLILWNILNALSYYYIFKKKNK